MKNDDIAFYVSLLSGIGTFISSIIALFALKEVMRQRRAMYQPKLYLNEFALAVKGNPFIEKRSLYYFHLHNLYEPVDKNDESGYSVMAQFFFENIGYGVASKIKCKWNFDYVKAVKLLCDLDSNLEYRIDKNDNSLLVTLDNKYFTSYQFNDLKKIKKIDFIKPESLHKNRKPTSIPIIITGLFMDYVMTKNKMYSEKTHRFQYEEFEAFPNPKLELSYEDLAGKRYEIVYEFKVKCSNSFTQMKNDAIDTNEEFAALAFYVQ